MVFNKYCTQVAKHSAKKLKGEEAEYFNYPETYFNPTIELTNVNKKNKRQNVAGSLKMKIPTITEPTAPIPVHTA